MAGINIDLLSLDSEQTNKIIGVAKVLTEYMREAEEVKEAMKDTVEQLLTDLGADKESAKDIKKHVKTVAKVHFKQSKEQLLDSNHKVEVLLDKLTENLVDRY